jgi:hypothetical protein
MEPVCSHNFSDIFQSFENRLNSLFQGNTKVLEGGDVRSPRNSIYYRYRKRIVSKSDTEIEISVYYDKEKDDYLYYTYNIFFNNNKLMFHYEPTHKEHFQPHINVYVDDRELKNVLGEGFHILSHKYHPFQIFDMIERYLRR